MLRHIKNPIFTFITLVLVSCSKESTELPELSQAQSRHDVEQEMMSLVNDYRVAMGHPSLEYSAIAYEYASSHTDYMIAKGSISHDNFSARASNIAAEVDAAFVAENVAKDYATAEDAFNGWLASAAHRKTIEGEFTHTAVSVKESASGVLYFTELFFR
jgi:uncharacterized protein YkwD